MSSANKVIITTDPICDDLLVDDDDDDVVESPVKVQQYNEIGNVIIIIMFIDCILQEQLLATTGWENYNGIQLFNRTLADVMSFSLYNIQGID